MLEKLTLVMPTFERQKYALRNMRFWSDQKATLLVLDGSENAIPYAELQRFEKNIQYYHLPNSLTDRISTACNLIRTPYTALLGDDEFHLPSGLTASIAELETNSDFVACMGRAIQFGENKGHVYGRSVYPKMADYSICSDDPYLRMEEHMRNYVPSTIYAVVRTDIWRSALKPYLIKELPVFAIGELQFEMGISFFGKSKVLPILQWFRSTEGIPIRGTDPSLVTSIRCYEWWPERGRAERTEITEIMANAWLDNGENKLATEKAIRNAFDAYVECADKRRSEKNKSNRNNTPKRPRKNPFPHLGKIRRLFPFMNRKSKRVSLYNCALMYQQSGVEVNFEEIETIESIVISHHSE